MREERLILPLVASSVLHVIVIAAAAFSFNAKRHWTATDLLRVTVIDSPPPREERPTVAEKQAAPARLAARFGSTPQKPRPREPIRKKPPVEPERKAVPAPELRTVQEPSKLSASPEPSKLEPSAPEPLALSPSLPGAAGGDGVGSFAGGGPGSGSEAGISRGDGDVANSASRHGSAGVGLHGQPGPVRTNRQARPVQTARASYPTMALRMGLEGDVVLKIEVDAEGNVTRAEVIKSAGAAFDDEALRAVKNSRFEPAEQDGKKVAAEFTYIYRFRLRK